MELPKTALVDQKRHSLPLPLKIMNISKDFTTHKALFIILLYLRKQIT